MCPRRRPRGGRRRPPATDGQALRLFAAKKERNNNILGAAPSRNTQNRSRANPSLGRRAQCDCVVRHTEQRLSCATFKRCTGPAPPRMRRCAALALQTAAHKTLRTTKTCNIADRSPTVLSDRRTYADGRRRSPYGRHHGHVSVVSRNGRRPAVDSVGRCGAYDSAAVQSAKNARPGAPHCRKFAADADRSPATPTGRRAHAGDRRGPPHSRCHAGTFLQREPPATQSF